MARIERPVVGTERGGCSTPRAEAGPRLAEHWAWRPDWTAERRCWWWYASFQTDRRVQRLAAEARATLRHPAPLDPIPPRWLHLSLLELGYGEDVPPSALYATARATARALGDLPAVDVLVGPLSTMASAVVLDVTDAGAPPGGSSRPAADLRSLHGALTDVARTTMGELPLQRRFRPHVSVAYVSADCEAPEAVDHRAAGRLRRVRTRIDRLILAEVVRDRRHYRWTGRSVVSLRPGADSTDRREREVPAPERHLRVCR